MTGWRILFRRHWQFALLLMMLALGVKALVPQGYMIMPSNGSVMISVCSGQGPQMVTLDAGKYQADHGEHQDGSKADHPCAFSGLGMSAMGGADVALLAIAIAYVLALGFGAIVAPPRPVAARLRPPLRAPPALG